MVLLNEDILKRNGGSWRAPPAAVEWAPDHVERAHAILAEHAGRPLWGFKDPRTLLTLDGWLRLVPDLEFAGVFRHPAQVARSLASRPKLQVEDPVELWRSHNAWLLEQHRRSAFPIVSFDDDPDVLARNFNRVAELLGLAPPTEEEPFFTDDLRGMRRGGGGAAGRRAGALRRAARNRALKVHAAAVRDPGHAGQRPPVSPRHRDEPRAPRHHLGARPVTALERARGRAPSGGASSAPRGVSASTNVSRAGSSI